MEWEKQEGTEMWKPEQENEELIGEILEVKEGLYGNQYVIKKEDGTTTMTTSHKFLQSRMRNAKTGDNVKIVYKGLEPPTVKGQNPMALYEVFIQK